VNRANPGGFHGGDFAGLTAQLDEIAELALTAIWITPSPARSTTAACAGAHGVTVPGGWFEHCAFHGYWADDYQTIDPRFGTEAELKALVEAGTHAASRCCSTSSTTTWAIDSHYLRDHPDWFRTKPVDCAVDEPQLPGGGLPISAPSCPRCRVTC